VWLANYKKMDEPCSSLTHSHMDCTIVADGLLHFEWVFIWAKSRMRDKQMRGHDGHAHAPVWTAACGELFCFVVTRREQLQTPRLQLGRWSASEKTYIVLGGALNSTHSLGTWTVSQTDSGCPNRSLGSSEHLLRLTFRLSL